MEKVSKFDENVRKAEAIIARLEQSEAISMEEYRRLAAEATSLLQLCRDELKGIASTEA
jgi:exonuclease VII small subunit